VYVALITEYFLRATKIPHAFLKSPVISKVAKYRARLNALNIEAETAAGVARESRIEIII